jgi:hypothetical protein
MSSILKVSNSDQDEEGSNTRVSLPSNSNTVVRTTTLTATTITATLTKKTYHSKVDVDNPTTVSPPSPIPYTMTNTYDNNTVLAWLQKQLTLYIDLHLISSVRDFTHVDYWFGKPLICLAHRFFPEILTDFLLALQQPVSTLTVFKEKLGLPPIQDSKDDLLGWFSQLRQALPNASDDNAQEQQLQESVLVPLTKLFQQAQELTRQETASTVSTSSISQRSSPSPRMLLDETEPVPLKNRLLQLSSGNTSESMEDLMQQALPICKQWQESHKPIGLRAAVEATYTALQLQMQKAQRNTSAEFTSTAAYIRNELEFIQAKMLKTTTTDMGIHDLEVRSMTVGKLIDTMAIQYKDMLEIQEENETYTALVDKYQLIVAWVDEVRIWFAEAERIRSWIEQRIHLLESRPLVSALDDVEYDYTKEEIDALNDAHNKLEQEVQAFDAQDMTRLRAHVKALTSNNHKDLSPADTTTIEITFTTLMTLDRLMHLCRRHAYELQMLTLRMAWEQNYLETVAWVRSTLEQVKVFVQTKARWKPDEDCVRTDIINTLIQFEKQTSMFDQGQFTTTVNLYQDMDDACHVELPSHLESRQVAIEEAFEELTNRIAFARQVVEQFLVVTDFLEKADHLKHEGEILRQEITKATEQSLLQANTTEFSEKVSLFQENTVRLVTTLRVPYPEATHPTDQQGNDEANEAIRMVMGARKSTLVLFGEALEHSLSAMRRALQLQKRAKQLHDEMSRLAGWVDERLKATEKAKVDEFFVAGKCGLDIDDLSRLQKERDGQVTKLLGIKDNEFKKLQENVQSIKQQHHSHDNTNAHMALQVNGLQEGLAKLGSQLDVLEEALQVHSTRLTILGQRIDWESQHAKASLWISNAIFEVWDFIARKAQWRIIEIDFEEESVKQILLDLQSKAQAFKQEQLEPVHNIFEALVQGFSKEKSPRKTLTFHINHPLSIESPALQLLLSQQDATTSVLTQVQRRQDTLDQSFDNLTDLIVFASEVLSQHIALIKFNDQACDLQSQGQQLVIGLENALTTVSNTTDEDAQAVEEFSQAVVQLWMQSGSQLPYPTCPEDARATRPSTNDDEISTEIATAVYKTYTDLQALAKLLQDLLQHLQIVTAYKLRLEQWCQETKITTSLVLEVMETVTTYSFDLVTGQVTYDQEPMTLEACQQHYRQLEEQMQTLSKTRIEPLKSQWTQLRDALVADNCDITVSFNEVTQEPLRHLEDAWQSLNQSTNVFAHRMRVCQDRAAWLTLWSTLWEKLESTHEGVLEWVNEKHLWLSRYEDDDGSESGVESLTLLVSQLSQLDTDYKKCMSEQSLPLSVAYDSLVESAQSLFDLKEEGGDGSLDHTEQQANLHKLASKIQDTLAAQHTELEDIQQRHNWQVSVDRLFQQCQQKESTTEAFIQSTARWSLSASSTPEGSQEQLSVLQQATSQLLQEIDALLSTELTHKSESIYRRRTELSFTRDRLQQHDAFAEEIMAQHCALDAYFAQLASVETLAETTQSKLLSDDSVDPTAVASYQQRVTDITKEAPNMYPVRHYRDHNPQSRKEDESHNATVAELIKARQARLVALGCTLEALQKSKERLSRRKATEASFEMEAGAIKGWIIEKRATFTQLQQIENLKEATEAVNALQASIDTYSISSLQGLQATYNQCVLIVQQQRGDDDGDSVEKSLEHMAQLHQEVEADWQSFVKDVRETQESMTQKLRRAEFLEVVQVFNGTCKDLQARVSDTALAEITEEVATQWENEVSALALDLKHCSRDNDVLKEEDLQSLLDKAVAQFDDLKAMIQVRAKEASHYRFKQQYFNGADALQAIMDAIQKSLLEVKQGSPHIMHGDDIKLDNALLTHITSTYASIAKDFDTEHQEKYDEQRSFYRFLQLNKVDHLEQVDQRQEQLEQQWKLLKSDIAQARQDAKMLAQWLALHEKLNEIKDEALSGIQERLNQFEDMKDTTMPSFLEQDAALLNLIRHRLLACLDITSTLTSEENLQAFQKRYDAVMLEVESVEALLDEKKVMALQHIEWVACQQGIDTLCETTQLEKQKLIEMQHKVETFKKDESESLDQVFRQVSTTLTISEAAQQALIQETDSEWLPRLNNLANKDTSELKQKIATAKEELSIVLQEAANTNDILRRVVGHNKSAADIQSWLMNCKQAIQNLNSGDNEDDAMELTALSLKLKDFEQVIESFMDLSKGLEDISHTLIDTTVKPVTNNISQLWEETQDEYKQAEIIVKKATRGITVARKMKHVMALIGDLREQVHSIQLFDYDAEIKPDDDEEVDDDKTEVELDISNMSIKDKNQILDSASETTATSTVLTSLLRQNEVEDLIKQLKSTADEIQPQIEQEMKELEIMMHEDVDTTFVHQHQELQASVVSLQDVLADKYSSLEKSLSIGRYLSIADDIDILQSGLEEALSQSSSSAPRHITQQQHQGRTDLQTKLIELDARFKYYEQNIIQKLTEAKQQSLLITGKGRIAVKAHIETMEQKWTWIKQQFKKRKIELSRTASSLDAENAMREARNRKSSLPTRKASSLLRDRASNLDINPHRLSPTSSLSGTPHRHRHISAGAMRLAPPQQLHQPSKSATQIKSMRPQATNSTSSVKKAPLNSYVADPANDLDIEIGRIVNETPYRVKVKMVPGEVGRYWFGNLNPKLAYCRVLKSKMVMVRVGGGWTELSQFLRDHALLEGDFIPRHRLHNNKKSNVIHEITEDQEPTSPSIQEGFIETHRVAGPTPKKSGSMVTGPTPKKSGSMVTGSPSHSASTQGAGYKEGDKFIAVDHQGNQLEVQMRRATQSHHFMSSSSNSSSSTTNSTTTSNSQQPQPQSQLSSQLQQQQPLQHVNDYTKRRIARRKEKKAVLNSTPSSQSSSSSQSVNNK